MSVTFKSKKTKAQISVEYLMIIAFSLLVLIPTSYFFYAYSRSSNEESVRSQINKLGTVMLTSAESVYGLAEGSVTTAEFNFPSNVKDVYMLNKKELIIKYDTTAGIGEAVFFSKIELTGNYTYNPALPIQVPRSPCVMFPCDNSSLTQNFPNQGKHNIKFESKGSYVLITNI